MHMQIFFYQEKQKYPWLILHLEAYANVLSNKISLPLSVYMVFDLL